MKILKVKIRVLAAWNNHGDYRSQAAKGTEPSVRFTEVSVL